MARTFTVERGIYTNRIKPSRAKRQVATQQAARFAKDPRTKGTAYTITCISLPVEDLVAIDEAAVAARKSRSQFLRDAALAFARAQKDS